ncbi:O-antigen ligase family protein [Methylocystis sp. B8]|uniref:O-antigen ligase family protein n=1 Tax=Methylocystis sp. B8 TaxID=544938 RepID=UPI0010FEE7B3|nr:O-antigen ligase family protein [Methylocystis sp. B8]TLG77634.1 O-antigen ligase family protein [Methylocystis sp. B8]
MSGFKEDVIFSFVPVIRRLIDVISGATQQEACAAPNPASERSANVTYLFAAYIVFIASMFLSNNFFLGHELFLYAVLPLAFLPFHIAQFRFRWRTLALPIAISAQNTARTLHMARSPMFGAAVLYTVCITASSWVHPEPDVLSFIQQMLLMIPVLLFLLVTARLVVDYHNFFDAFYTILAPTVALNAAANLVVFVKGLPDLASIVDNRLYPTYGLATAFWPTNASLTYAMFFVASVATASILESNWRRVLLLLSALVLFIAILLTQGRGALVGSVGSLCVYSLISSRRIRQAIILFAAITAFLVIIIPHFRDLALRRGDGLRLEIWSKFIPMALEQPFSGYGQRIIFGVPVSNGERILHPHNMVLAAQIRGGLGAGLAMLVLLLGGVRSTFSYYRAGGNPAPLCVLLTLSIAGLVDYEVQTSFANWYWVTFWLPFGLCIGSDVALRKGQTKALGSMKTLGSL